MQVRSYLLLPLPRGRTSHADAWEKGDYDTYRLMFELPAVRVHSRFRECGGRWYAVDTYDVSLSGFQQSLALVNAKGRAWVFKRPDVDWCLLLPGTVVNVGLAASQGFHEGGGLQFECVSGPHAQLLSHESGKKRVRL